MALDLDVSNAGVAAENLLKASTSPVKAIPIYWGGAMLPKPLPDKFIVIEPLYPTEWRSWGMQRAASHTIQVRAVARTIGDSTNLRGQVANLLPATMFGTVTHGPTIRIDSHYDSILTARTITVASESE